MVLNAIYEGDFVGFSYGFRPGRGPHDAFDALSTAIKTRKVTAQVGCQRHLNDASVFQSKNTSVMLARRPPNWV